MRLIDDKGGQLGILSLKEALGKASSMSLDLVEVSPHAKPPVCRIMDFGKHRFENSKQRAVQRKKQRQKKVQLKELKFGVRIEEADYQVKLRNLIRFLDDGNKVKISLRFRGREMAHQEIGMQLMQRVKASSDPFAVVESEPKLDGRQMIMVLAPRKK